MKTVRMELDFSKPTTLSLGKVNAALLDATTLNFSCLDELRKKLHAATSIEDLRACCKQEAKDLGFNSFVYALRVPTNFTNAQLVIVDGYPQGWVKRYFEAAYFDVDPVMHWCKTQVLPLIWSDLVLAEGSLARKMMQEAADFGLRDGVTMPVHSPQGELGILSMSIDASREVTRPILQRTLPYIQLMASHLHHAVRRLSATALPDAPEMSARVNECLRWAAEGKTTGEIAQILGISDSTVNFHLNNAMQKLNVVNRQQGIGKVALQGLIQPKPF